GVAATGCGCARRAGLGRFGRRCGLGGLGGRSGRLGGRPAGVGTGLLVVATAGGEHGGKRGAATDRERAAARDTGQQAVGDGLVGGLVGCRRRGSVVLSHVVVPLVLIV